MVKRKKQKFGLKAKPIIVIMLLCMVGLLDVILLVNPNDLVFVDLEITECEYDCETKEILKDDLETAKFQPILRHNENSKQKLILKGGTRLQFDSLHLSDAPNPSSDEILWFM